MGSDRSNKSDGMKPAAPIRLAMGFQAAASVFSSWWHTPKATPVVHAAAKQKQRESATKTTPSVAPAPEHKTNSSAVQETAKESKQIKLHGTSNEETEDRNRAKAAEVAKKAEAKLQDMTAKQECRQKEEQKAK